MLVVRRPLQHLVVDRVWRYVAGGVMDRLSMMVFAMTIAVMLVLEEDLLSNQVDCKCADSNSEPWESSFEPVPPGEGARRSPCLTIALSALPSTYKLILHSLSLPRVF